jgi:hypothetical protein
MHGSYPEKKPSRGANGARKSGTSEPAVHRAATEAGSKEGIQWLVQRREEREAVEEGRRHLLESI